MAQDQKAILAVILAVKRGFVSPEEGMQILEQAEAGVDPDPEQTLFGHIPAAHHEEIKREAGTLASDTKEAARILDEAGVSPSVQHTLLSLGGAVPASRSDVANTLISIAPAAATPARDTARLNVGEDRYKLLREHARGGMGRILVAMDTVVGREVALKELLPMATGSGTGGGTPASNTSTSAVARFLREATVTGQLEHPNIVPVYEIGKRDDGSLYYTMKFVKGRTLATRLRAIRTDVDLDAEEKFAERLKLLDAFVDICNAIAFAHSRGVIHRDIKPANIMLGDFGEALVLDWGLARVKEKDDLVAKAENTSHDSADLTMEGEVMGTPAYMAPEQAAGKLGEVDERSDVYALGAVLYEIVSGEAPYKGNSAKQVLSAVLNDAPRDIDELLPEMPPELAALVMRAIERDPAERIQTARELAEQVQAYRDGRMLSVYDYSTFEIAKRFVKRHRGTVSVGALALLLLLTGGIYSYQNVMTQRDAALRAEQDALAQKTIASEQAIEAQRQKRIAEEQAKEAERQRTAAEKSTIEATGQRVVAEYQTRVAKEALGTAEASKAEAERRAREARDALALSRRSMAHAHLGHALLAEARDDLSERVLQLAAAHEADPSVVGQAEVVTALNESSFPIWRSRSHVDLPAGTATYSRDRSLCAAPLMTPLASIDDFINRRDLANLTDIGIWDVASGTLLRRMTTGVNTKRQLHFSPDASRLAVADETGRVRLWDLATGEEILNRPAHTWQSARVAGAPDSDLFFTVGADGNLLEWSFSEASLLRKRTFKGAAFTCVAVSPDGQSVAAATASNTLYFWDAGNLAEPAIVAISGRATCLCFVDQGVIVGYAAGGFELLEPGQHTVVRSYQTTSPVRTFAASASGDRLIATLESGQWLLFDVGSSSPVGGGRDGRHILNSAFAPLDDAILLTVKNEGFDVLQLSEESLLLRKPEHIGASYALDFTPDGSSFASGGADGRLLVRCSATGKVQFSMQVTSEGIARTLYSPDGSSLLLCTELGRVIMLEAATGKRRYTLRMNLSPFGIKYSPCGTYFSAPTTDGGCHLVQARDGTIVYSTEVCGPGGVLLTEFDPIHERLWLYDRAFLLWSWYWRDGDPGAADGTIDTGADKACFSMASNRSGTLLALTMNTGQIYTYSHAQGMVVSVVNLGDERPAFSQAIVNCSFGASERYVVCGDAGGKLNFVDVIDGDVVLRLRAHRSSILTTVVSPDGRNIVTSAVDGECAVWRAPQFLRAELLDTGIHYGGDVTLSADGTLAAAAADYGRVVLFDPQTFEPKGEIPLTNMYISGVAFSPDGRHLAVTYYEGRLLLWDVVGQRRLAVVTLHDRTYGVCYDHRGRLVIGGYYDGVQIRDPADLSLLQSIAAGQGHSWLRLFPDGRRLLSLGSDSEPVILDLESGEVLLTLERTTYSSHTAAITPDGKSVLLPRDGGLLVLHDAGTGARLRSLRINMDFVTSLEFLSGADRIVVTGDSLSAAVIDFSSGRRLAETRFNLSYTTSTALSPDGRFLLASGSEGKVERWSLRGALFRIDRLSGVSSGELMGIATLLSNKKLNLLRAVDLPRTTGNITWNTPDGRPPEFLQGGLPMWSPRAEGEHMDAASRFMDQETVSRERRTARFATEWQDQFEGFRYRLIERADLTLVREDIPPRQRDASGALVGDAEGHIDFEAYAAHQRRRRNEAIAAAASDALLKASTASRNGDAETAMYYYERLIELEPTQFKWLTRFADEGLKAGEFWRVSYLASEFVFRVGPEDAGRLHLYRARCSVDSWNPSHIHEYFAEAVEAGYKREDWRLYLVQTLITNGSYDAAIQSADNGLAHARSPATRTRIAAARAEARLLRALPDRQGLAATSIVLSVAEGSAAAAAGFRPGDVIQELTLPHHPGRHIWNYEADKFLKTWRELLNTTRPAEDFATVRVWRNGTELTLNHPHAPLELKLLTLRSSVD